jgi:hypothetical protein
MRGYHVAEGLRMHPKIFLSHLVAEGIHDWTLDGLNGEVDPELPHSLTWTLGESRPDAVTKKM